MLTREIWFGLLVTLAVWDGAQRLNRKWPTPLLNPVMIAMAVIIGLLLLFRVPYENYNVGGKWLSFLLGPCVVALAVPLVRQLEKVKANLGGIVVSVAFGSVVGIVSAMLITLLLGGDRQLALTLAPKSVTTPIAIAIANQIGGLPDLTAAIVVITGVIGGMLGPEAIRMLGLRGRIPVGLGVGAASHGIGTARVIRDDPLTGAMSGIAMTLNGLITAVILPPLLPLILHLAAHLHPG